MLADVAQNGIVYERLFGAQQVKCTRLYFPSRFTKSFLPLRNPDIAGEFSMFKMNRAITWVMSSVSQSPST